MNKFYKFYLTGFFIILALHLLAIPPLFFPPEWAKSIVFRTVLSIILLLFSWQAISKNNFLNQVKERAARQKKSLLTLAVICLLALLATFLSSDILFSLWASPHRSGGIVNFIFYILFSASLFLILRNNDWKKLWDFSFIVGNVVALLGLVQYFNLLPQIFITYGRPVSTLSNTILLSIYLVVLIFSVAPFIILEKTKKRFFYIASLLLFIFGLFLTGSRAGWTGLVIGAFYFLFFYPVINRKISFSFKIASAALIIFGIFSVYYLNINDNLPGFLDKIKILKEIQARTSIDLLLSEPRFSAWQVAFEAIKEKPVFGWGPENQSIGFDKYYDPSLPYLTKEWGDWWDRAHNIFLDLPLQYGIPFLIAYIFLFGYLLWKLQKTKHQTDNKEAKITAHGMQSVFLAYFATLIFGFDSVSTLIILFFIVGYALFLTAPKQETTSKNLQQSEKTNKKWQFFYQKRKIIAGMLLIVLIWFLWQYNLKPLAINAKIESVEKLDCSARIPALEKLFSQKSFLDAYLRLTYAEDIKACAEINPSKTIEYMEKGIEALERASGVRPRYTRTWILLGSFKTILFVNETNPQIKKNLYNEINYDFGRALILGPKHQEIFSEWAKLYFAAEDYSEMKNLSEKCVALNADTNTCYWYLGLAEIMLGEQKKGEGHLRIATENGFAAGAATSLSQLAIVYSKLKNYKKLIPVYEALISLNPRNIQYYATLAAVYKELGDYKNARKIALEILKIEPAAENDINEFLKTLPY